jgi:hypothetical protein
MSRPISATPPGCCGNSGKSPFAGRDYKVEDLERDKQTIEDEEKNFQRTIAARFCFRTGKLLLIKEKRSGETFGEMDVRHHAARAPTPDAFKNREGGFHDPSKFLNGIALFGTQRYTG